MWCPEGYVLLSEVAHSLKIAAYEAAGPSHDFLSTSDGRRLLSLARRGTFLEPFDEVEAYADWLLLSFITLFESDLQVAVASGVAVRLPKGYAATDMTIDVMEELLAEEYQEAVGFDTFYSFPVARGDRMKAADYSLLYINRSDMTLDARALKGSAVSVIDGMPLCVNSALVPSKSQDLIELVCAKQLAMGKGVQSSLEAGRPRISDQIVKALQAGQIITKSDAKLRFAKGIKTEAFNAAWRDVAAVLPDVSKPGPKRKRPNS